MLIVESPALYILSTGEILRSAGQHLNISKPHNPFREY
jgi:hypothetical protein